MFSATLRRRIVTANGVKRCPSAFRSYATPTTYKPEPDPQLNGYPELPHISKQKLPPTGWWDQQNRRDFGETLHEKEELYSMWGPDIPVVPPQTALFQFTIAVLGFVGFGFLANYYLVPEIPVVRRQYPYSGLITELGSLEANKAREETGIDDDQ